MHAKPKGGIRIIYAEVFIFDISLIEADFAMDKHTKFFFRTSLKEALVILVLAGCLAFSINALRTDGIGLFSGPPVQPDNAADLPDIEQDGVTRISIQAAINDFEQKTAVFLDARSSEDYALGHIAGAVSFPDRLFDDRIGPFLENTPPEVKLITYCEGERCALSKNLAEKLSLAGYENVYLLVDGWGQWKKLRLPVEREEE